MSLIALILFLSISTLHCIGLLFTEPKLKAFFQRRRFKKIAGVSKVRLRRLVVNKLITYLRSLHYFDTCG